jgi:hypothetical protein
MTTAELLNILEEQFPGWNRDGTRGLLRYVDMAQKALCMIPAEQLLIFDTTTGKLPIIATTTSVFEYTMPAEVSFVDEVLVEAGDANFSNLQTLSYQDYGRTSRSAYLPEYRTIAGIEYLRIRFIRSWPASESSNARILFTKNPGTAAASYRRRSYRWPATLESDAIELTIPPPYDELYLLPAVGKLIEGVNHGNYIEARSAIVRDFKPLMWAAFNTGEQGKDYEPEERGF